MILPTINYDKLLKSVYKILGLPDEDDDNFTDAVEHLKQLETMSYILLITRRGYSQNLNQPIAIKLTIYNNLFRLIAILLFTRIIIGTLLPDSDYQTLIANPLTETHDQEKLIIYITISLIIGWILREYIIYTEERGKFILPYNRINKLINRPCNRNYLKSNRKVYTCFTKLSIRTIRTSFLLMILCVIGIRANNSKVFSSSSLFISSCFWIIIEIIVYSLGPISIISKFFSLLNVMLIYYFNLNSLNRLCESCIKRKVNRFYVMRSINFKIIQFMNEIDCFYRNCKYTFFGLLFYGSMYGAFEIFLGLIDPIISIEFSRTLGLCGMSIYSFAGFAGYLSSGFHSKVRERKYHRTCNI